MNKIIVTMLIPLFCITCNDKAIETETCICNNSSILKEFGIQEAIIIFPRTATMLYQIHTVNDIFPDGKFFNVCTDSDLRDKIKSLNLKDSSMIKFTGGIIGDNNCNFESNGATVSPFPIITVKSIELK
jgi:hypothetical protein